MLASQDYGAGLSWPPKIFPLTSFAPLSYSIITNSSSSSSIRSCSDINSRSIFRFGQKLKCSPSSCPGSAQPIIFALSSQTPFQPKPFLVFASRDSVHVFLLFLFLLAWRRSVAAAVRVVAPLEECSHFQQQQQEQQLGQHPRLEGNGLVKVLLSLHPVSILIFIFLQHHIIARSILLFLLFLLLPLNLLFLPLLSIVAAIKALLYLP